jgi:hypothetical protein
MKNLEDLILYLGANFTEEYITEMLDEEIINWVDEDWQEDYESEYDWYVDHNNNEAEDAIIEVIRKQVKKDLPDLDESIDVYDVIKELYQDLE